MTPEPADLARLRHELRTPLNHIIGYSEMLLEEVGEKDRVALSGGLRRIHEDGKRLLALITEFLSPAQEDTGAPDLASIRAALTSPLERIIACTERLKKEAQQGSATDLLPDIDRICSAAARLLAVADHGGIPFAAGSRADRPGGRETGATEDPSRLSGDEGVILVVDDDQSNREMLARRLAREGHHVHAAADGPAALDLLKAQPIDLVLLDVMMPGMDGYEVLRRLKSDPALREVPVLMISALDELDSVVRCVQLGAEDYLPKPFDPVLLRARIGACLEKKRLRDQEARHLSELSEWNRTLEQRVQEQVSQVERLGRLKRFFSPQLAELILAGGADDPLKSHRRQVTVVFLDLRGFTAFAETAEPEEVMTVLREYHAEMGKLILEHEGTLERFTGDGMMIFFNDPVPVPNPAERAIRMAVAMRERVNELSAAWRKRGYDLALGVGIAEGYATIGAIGFEGRWDYGAIGTVTNLAARLCGEAKGGQILVTSRVAGALEDLIECEGVGALPLKGLLKPVSTFHVRGLRSSP
jgi:adenylate cyclase